MCCRSSVKACKLFCTTLQACTIHDGCICRKSGRKYGTYTYCAETLKWRSWGSFLLYLVECSKWKYPLLCSSMEYFCIHYTNWVLRQAIISIRRCLKFQCQYIIDIELETELFIKKMGNKSAAPKVPLRSIFEFEVDSSTSTEKVSLATFK